MTAAGLGLPRLITNEHGALVAVGVIEQTASRKRRRTTPEEFAILEAEFKKNALPSQHERATIAKMVNMSGRAVQVWFQNRRQKEKRDANTYKPPVTASTSGSGTDSAPDSDQDARDHDGMSFAFSSSPLPSPALLNTPTATDGHLTRQQQTSYFALLQANNKENRSSSASNGRASLPLEVQTTFPAQSDRNNAFLHRPANSSRIAAKKHVKKRPLGSHAPMARTPSLNLPFDFPPSPPQRSASLDGAFPTRPPIRRQGSSTSTTSARSPINFDLSQDGRARVFPFTGAEGQHPSIKVESPLEDAALDSRTQPQDVWTHMATSPPPSSPAHSPEKPQDTPALQFANPTRRPSATESVRSLGGSKAKASRAGQCDTDAQTAFERKKRVMESTSNVTMSSYQQRGGSTAPFAGQKRRKTEDSGSSSRRDDSETASVDGCSRSDRSESCSSRDTSAVPELDRSFSDGINSSFESNASQSVPTPPHSSSLSKSVARSTTRKSAVTQDDERECAELLLGLGGFLTSAQRSTARIVA